MLLGLYSRLYVNSIVLDYINRIKCLTPHMLQFGCYSSVVMISVTGLLCQILLLARELRLAITYIAYIAGRKNCSQAHA